MIAIVNITPEGSDSRGLHLYEVKINSKPVAQFSHKREDGLEKCLRLAADAVRDQKAKSAQALVHRLHEAFYPKPNGLPQED